MKEVKGLTPLERLNPNQNAIIPQEKLNALSWLKEFRLSEDDLNEEVNYLVKDFLVEQTITNIYAKAGHGKSFLALYIALNLLDEKKINECYYIDLDNSKKALQSRGLDKIIVKYRNLNYIHRSKFKQAVEVIGTIKQQLQKPELKDLYKMLIVVDSVRDFLGGKDMLKDKDVIPLMDDLKTLREAGATIIFLHHANKENGAKGATAFIDSVDVAYQLKSIQLIKHQKISYALEVKKDRIAVVNTGFELDTVAQVLSAGNFEVANLDDEELELISTFKEILEENPEGISQSQILKEAGSSTDNRTHRKLLQKMDGVFWRTYKGANNANMYRSL